jgi:hypothetical protein
MKMLLAFMSAVVGVVVPQAAPAVERPPQFIAIAFDNCTENERWQDWTDFAADMNRDGEKLRFTFFVSGINFLASAKKHLYQGPNQARGASRINFGGSQDDVRKRIAFINALHRQGHEIASHAVGHFDGRAWSASQWSSEFASFDFLMSNSAANNELSPEEGLAVTPKDLAGFRAPYLAHSPGLYATLAERGFRYDASGTAPSYAWPEKRDGIWRFNLASIRVSGSGRSILSMDYNFLVAQSGAASISALREPFRLQMLDSYLAYFRANYTGNRAPIHIGHHFSDYQNGAYRDALKSFVRAVCGLPEVRCVTYKALADFMDGLSEQKLADFRAGRFDRATMPAILVSSGIAQPQP